MGVRAHTAAERPDLMTHGIPDSAVWPEYNLHGDVASALWPRLFADLAAFQFGLYDEDTDELVAEGHTVPCWWDGTEAGLSSGIDDTLQDAFARLDAGAPVNTVCAVAAEIPPANRGRGLAATILQSMAAVGERAGLAHLIAPVRPSMKDRYPITPIERYVRWRRADGRLFDPWIRVHERLGARVSRPLPRSLSVSGTVADWEAWTALDLPDSGDYVFPGGLAPLTVDQGADRGEYHEPNVWMIHR